MHDSDGNDTILETPVLSGPTKADVDHMFKLHEERCVEDRFKIH